jgi:hypothetical protein
MLVYILERCLKLNREINKNYFSRNKNGVLTRRVANRARAALHKRVEALHTIEIYDKFI